MSEILPIFHPSPPLYPHFQRDVVNVDSHQCNWSFESHFHCLEFAGGSFTDFSSSTVDELSKVTTVIEEKQNTMKRKFENVDCDSGLAGPHKARRTIHDGNSKPKMDTELDYIHVRARRGQATDSHSLAERARREKIKKRMQYLQDLVPGCNKLTNKAAILDQIINYVQCLQRDIEFLTLKLAASTTSVGFTMDNSLLEEFSAAATVDTSFPEVVNLNYQHYDSDKMVASGMDSS
ncbi:hypothetical protein QVD17_36960 [Tagetes erecta]|uniref:BHLH domain-containing protein n=1 Tax=Tagetes erecta TaxID=13708 RepID=A0AAD8JV16_TARER|nr:hypothetical protein QVD17_36960 [Tagetes erecta]